MSAMCSIFPRGGFEVETRNGAVRHPDGRTSKPVSVNIVSDETNEVTVTLPQHGND
jgi:hypothetical protein